MVLMGAKTPLNFDVTAVILAHGVWSLILHGDGNWIERNTPEAQKAVHLMMRIHFALADVMFPLSPMPEDVPSIVKLAVSAIEWAFAGESGWNEAF